VERRAVRSLGHGQAREGDREVLTESLTALASLAANTVITAATTDAWETAMHRFARLLGRGDIDQTRVAERRLAETRDQLILVGLDPENTRSALEAQWVTRLADLLEEHPDAEPDLRALVEAVQAVLPAAVVSAADHAVAAGRDVTITASGGGVAAGVIHGTVVPPNPSRPGPAS
jgi:beta-phosphoglucomutase-like phosphatase (HAD superfamily)